MNNKSKESKEKKHIRGSLILVHPGEVTAKLDSFTTTTWTKIVCLFLEHDDNFDNEQADNCMAEIKRTDFSSVYPVLFKPYLSVDNVKNNSKKFIQKMKEKLCGIYDAKVVQGIESRLFMNYAITIESGLFLLAEEGFTFNEVEKIRRDTIDETCEVYLKRILPKLVDTTIAEAKENSLTFSENFTVAVTQKITQSTMKDLWTNFALKNTHLGLKLVFVDELDKICKTKSKDTFAEEKEASKDKNCRDFFANPFQKNYDYFHVEVYGNPMKVKSLKIRWVDVPEAWIQALVDKINSSLDLERDVDVNNVPDMIKIVQEHYDQLHLPDNEDREEIKVHKRMKEIYSELKADSKKAFVEFGEKLLREQKAKPSKETSSSPLSSMPKSSRPN